jgi:hypothetical protein
MKSTRINEREKRKWQVIEDIAEMNAGGRLR